MYIFLFCNKMFPPLSQFSHGGKGIKLKSRPHAAVETDPARSEQKGPTPLKIDSAEAD